MPELKLCLPLLRFSVESSIGSNDSSKLCGHHGDDASASVSLASVGAGTLLRFDSMYPPAADGKAEQHLQPSSHA